MKPFREFLAGLEKSPVEIQAIVGAFMSAAVYGLCLLIAFSLKGLVTGRDAVVVSSIIIGSSLLAASALSIASGVIVWAKGRPGVGFGMIFSPLFLLILFGPQC